ncbi:hypothetical protein ABZ371_09805 [Streptomyces sp. NPDC005899]|uniref:hypothetical protein n=1 Tax=Streptomyces sp. NPDC005899 TaxID=3155716 RepID=UPI00340A7C21
MRPPTPHATTLTSQAPAGKAEPGSSPAVYGIPSPALLARAHRGYARFLDQQPEGQAGEAAHRTSTAR